MTASALMLAFVFAQSSGGNTDQTGGTLKDKAVIDTPAAGRGNVRPGSEGQPGLDEDRPLPKGEAIGPETGQAPAGTPDPRAGNVDTRTGGEDSKSRPQDEQNKQNKQDGQDEKARGQDTRGRSQKEAPAPSPAGSR